MAQYPQRYRLNLSESNGSVVVAMPVMWVMQMSIHQVAHVISVRNCFVTAVWAMNVVSIVPATLVVRCTSCRIGF